MADESSQGLEKPLSPSRRELIKKGGALAALPFLGRKKESEPQLETGLKFPAIVGILYETHIEPATGRPYPLSPTRKVIPGRLVSLVKRVREEGDSAYFEEAGRTQTDQNGYYFFDALTPGHYQVDIVPDEKEMREGSVMPFVETPNTNGGVFDVDSEMTIIIGPLIGILQEFAPPYIPPHRGPEEPTQPDPTKL